MKFNYFISFKRINDRYYIEDFTNDQILTVGNFLLDCFDFNELIDSLRNKPNVIFYGANETRGIITDKAITLSLEYQEDSPEFQFTLPKETLINLLEDWVNVKKQDPQLVTLYWDNGKYWFEIEK